jgi:hypothetical protein
LGARDGDEGDVSVAQAVSDHRPVFYRNVGEPEYREVDDKPPEFITRNANEKRHMFKWVCSRLDDWIEEREWRGTHADEDFDETADQAVEAECAETDVDAALRVAERGNIEPLRRLFPRIARFINLPKREDRSTWTDQTKRLWRDPLNRTPRDHLDRTERVELAAAEAIIVRVIWQRHYHQSNQLRDVVNSQWTPEQIVAERWDVKVKEVSERIKRIKRPKPPNDDQWTPEHIAAGFKGLKFD